MQEILHIPLILGLFFSTLIANVEKITHLAPQKSVTIETVSPANSQPEEYRQINISSAPAPTTAIKKPSVQNTAPATLVSIRINYNGPDTIYFNEVADISAVGLYSDGKESPVNATWSVNSGLKLSQTSGKYVSIEATSDGQTSITATYLGKSASRALKVVSPEKAELLYWGSDDPYAYTINGYGYYYLKLTYKDSYSYPTGSWSADDNCATFSQQDFKVKATFTKTGDCKINVSFQNLRASKTIRIVTEGVIP